MDDKVSKLKSVADLRDSGVLTEAEFQQQKAKILAEPGQQHGAGGRPARRAARGGGRGARS